MGSGATAKYALEYPLGTDAPNIPGDMQQLAQQIDAIMVGFAPDDTLANRPAVGKSGRMFVESAASAGLPGTAWRDDGVSWRALGSRVSPQNATDVGQIIRAFAGQSADVQKYQSSAGADIARVDSSGYGYFGKVVAAPNGVGVTPRRGLDAYDTRAIIGGTTTPATTGTLSVLSEAAADVATVIMGAASQTGDLTQWQNNSGAVIAGMVAAGGFYAGSAGRDAGVDHQFTGLGAGNITQLIKGIAAQTGDLQRWHSSAGAQLAAVDIGGGIFAKNFWAGTRSSFGAVVNVNPTATTMQGIIVKGIASQTANLQEWQDSTGAIKAAITSAGNFYGQNLINPANSGAYISLNPTNIGITQQGAGNTGVTPLYVRAMAGQTADIQQWQDSTANTVAAVETSGAMYAKGASGNGKLRISGGNATNAGYIEWYGPNGTRLGYMGNNGNATTGDQGTVSIQAGTFAVNGTSAAITTAVVNGAASQTASLEDWRVNGTTLAQVLASGTIQVLGGANFYTTGGSVGVNIAPFTGSARLAVQTTAVGEVGAFIRGAASQTGDLQQWQNSAGGLLARIDSGGVPHFGSDVFAVGIGAFGGAPYFGAILNAQPRSATETGAVVRGFASQTNDLMQWQNSAGTMLSKVASDGGFQAPFFGSTNGTHAFYSDGASNPSALIRPAGAGLIGLVVKGQNAQTQDLQQWQSGGGSIWAKVNSGGEGYFNILHVWPQTGAGTGSDGVVRMYVGGAMQGAFVAPGAAGNWCTTAAVGDMVIRSETGKLWFANNGGTPLFCINAQGGIAPGREVGGARNGSTIFSGSGVPNNASASNGDFYFRVDGGAGSSLYMKRGGAWVGIL